VPVRGELVVDAPVAAVWSPVATFTEATVPSMGEVRVAPARNCRVLASLLVAAATWAVAAACWAALAEAVSVTCCWAATRAAEALSTAACRSVVSTVASTAPFATVIPTVAGTEVTVPATGNARSDSTAGSIVPVAVTVWSRVSVLRLREVCKTYRTGSLEVEALRDVSLDVAEGEHVAVIGPSGSGKSTLMHLLGCLDIPSAGTYELAGTNVSRMDEHELAEVRNRRIGFVFQQFNLLPRLSAWRNVELPLCYAGVDRAERRERAVRALERVGLADRVEHRPGELSGGQQQRVAIARALVTEPALLLADEPTGNLDSRSSAEVLGLFDELHHAGRTIVLITHEPTVAAVAQRTMRIRDGLLDELVATVGTR